MINLRLTFLVCLTSSTLLAAGDVNRPTNEDLSEFGDSVSTQPAPSPAAAAATTPASSPAPKTAAAPNNSDQKLTDELDTPTTPVAPVVAATPPPAASPAPAPVAAATPAPPPPPEIAPESSPVEADLAPSKRSGPAAPTKDELQDIEPPPPEIVNGQPEGLPEAPSSAAAPEPAPAPVAKNNSESQSGVEPAIEPSESDSKREKRFVRIYQKYNKQEIGDNKWAEIAGDKVSESYTLQNGDTLWDISSKLFGNAFYWPKVWELNDDITNPHDVKIGKALKFSPGSSTTAPSLNVEPVVNVNLTQATTPENYDEIADADQSLDYDTIITGDAEGSQVPIPPGKRSRPVLNRIPPSFREVAQSSGRYDAQTGFAKDGLKRPELKITRGPVPSIVVENEWSRDGKIIEMEGDTTVASTYQDVIIRLSDTAKEGDFFTVFSTNGKVTDPTTGYSIGVELETRAEIQIEEPIEGAEDTYRAMVVYTAMPVRLNDSLKAGRLITRTDFEMEGSPGSVAARIVNGESNKRFIFGLHGVVFIDKGQEDGVTVGTLLPVLKNIAVRNPDTALEFDSRPIGAIKIVEVEAHVATAVIVSEQDAILPGDMTALVSDAKSVSPAKLDTATPEDSTIVKDEE